MYTELTAGYHVDPERLINDAIFDVDYSEMVVVKDIPFYSLCEHHLLPFFGTAAVAYIPRGRVIGLSKIPRVVEMYARRLQVQERLTQQVADFLQERLEPAGRRRRRRGDPPVRGDARRAQARARSMTTSAVLGLFRSRDRTRAEFFAHLDRPAPGRLRAAAEPGCQKKVRPGSPGAEIVESLRGGSFAASESVRSANNRASWWVGTERREPELVRVRRVPDPKVAVVDPFGATQLASALSSIRS